MGAGRFPFQTIPPPIMERYPQGVHERQFLKFLKIFRRKKIVTVIEKVLGKWSTPVNYKVGVKKFGLLGLSF